MASQCANSFHWNTGRPPCLQIPTESELKTDKALYIVVGHVLIAHIFSPSQPCARSHLFVMSAALWISHTVCYYSGIVIWYVWLYSTAECTAKVMIIIWFCSKPQYSLSSASAWIGIGFLLLEKNCIETLLEILFRWTKEDLVGGVGGQSTNNGFHN